MNETRSRPVHPAIADVSALSWELVLAELEGTLDEAERLFTDTGHRTVSSGPWQPPAEMGPLPEHLRTRAAELLDRQAATAQELSQHISQARKLRELAARMSPRPARPVAAYVDKEL